MKMSGRPAAMFLIGLGLGAIGGVYLDAVNVWGGLALVVVGVGVAIASGPRAPTLQAPPTLPAPPTPPADPTVQPSTARRGVSGLAPQVERILRLAEEQANDLRAEAKRAAEQIVADAQAEARAIIQKAREQAP